MLLKPVWKELVVLQKTHSLLIEQTLGRLRVPVCVAAAVNAIRFYTLENTGL